VYYPGPAPPLANQYTTQCHLSAESRVATVTFDIIVKLSKNGFTDFGKTWYAYRKCILNFSEKFDLELRVATNELRLGIKEHAQLTLCGALQSSSRGRRHCCVAYLILLVVKNSDDKGPTTQ
jgi:hypothetical protein